MTHNSTIANSGSRSHNLFSPVLARNGGNIFFPWSPRTASFIARPEISHTKPNFSTQVPVTVKSNITAKIQEVSIDQTWFGKNNTTHKVGKMNSESVREKEVGGTYSDLPAPAITEEFIDKLVVPVANHQVIGEINENNYSLRKDHSGIQNQLDSSAGAEQERLDTIEHLILPDTRVLKELDHLCCKSESENKERPIQTSNNQDNTCPSQYIQGHCHSAHSCSQAESVCSSCSTFPSRSRCSSGDGCSSVECDSRHDCVCLQHGQDFHGSVEQRQLKSLITGKYDSRQNKQDVFLNVSHNCNYNSDFLRNIQHENSYDLRTPQTDRDLKLGGHVCEESVNTDHMIPEVSDGQHITCKAASVSQIEMMVYIMKLQISKYGELMTVIESQQQSVISQRQCVNRLLPCVTLLSMKLQQQTRTLDSLTAVLRKQEAEGRSTRHRQTIIFTIVLALLFIGILQLGAVRGKITAIFTRFGITKQLKSLNRTRKMVSENWRNIPSLLTNFWRIFIFDGRTG